jgi:hypothetical protein
MVKDQATLLIIEKEKRRQTSPQERVAKKHKVIT